MEVIKDEKVSEDTKQKDVVTKQMVDDVKAEYDATKADNRKKVYGLEVTEDLKQSMLDYMTNDVEWSFMEAVGIPKICDALSKEKIKSGSIYIGGLELEALAFYLSKAKGKGRKAAENFLAMNSAVNAAYGLRAEDNKTESTLQQKYDYLNGAYEQGLSVEDSAKEENE